MTMLDTMTVQLHNMPFWASMEKFSNLLRQKTEEAMSAIDSIQDIAERHVNHALRSNLAQPMLRRSKTLLSKTAEISKIGVAGIFAGVFCIFFSLIYTMVCYANRREPTR